MSGPLDVSECHVDGDASLQRAAASGIDVNASTFDKRLNLGQVYVGDSLGFGCSRVSQVDLWLSNVPGQVQFDHTAFHDANVGAAMSRMGALVLSEAQGRIENFGLEGARIGRLELERDNAQAQKFTIGDCTTSGLEFGQVQGNIDSTRVRTFFDGAVKGNDQTAYRRLARAYAAAGNLDEADIALRSHSFLLGLARRIPIVLAAATLMWVLATLFLRQSLAGLRMLEGSALSLDLLLPDLVDLGFRTKREEALSALPVGKRVVIALYRLFGWAVLSAIIAAVTIRASY